MDDLLRPELGDVVILTDGRIGEVVFILKPGVAYEVEFPTPDGEHAYESESVLMGKILGIVN